MRTRDKISAGLLTLVLVSSILPLGGAMRWGQAIVSIAVGIALVPSLWSRQVSKTLSPLLVLLALAMTFTVLQLLPLPGGVVAFLDPTGEALRSDGAALAGTSPISTLSRDPASTLRALGFFAILLGTAIVALRLAVHERGRYFVTASLAITIGATAVITVVHEVVGATSLYGVYQPRATPSVLGPLLNENHLGGLLAIGAIAGIGLLFYERQPTWRRGLWLMLVIGSSATAVLTRSRGASIALAAGVIVTLGVIAAQRFGARSQAHRRARLLTRALPIGIVALSTIVIAIYASSGGLQRELEKTSLREIDSTRSKFEAWRSAVSLIEESPWVGVGRGAMESSFTRVHAASGQVTFSYLENEYIQAVVDFGIPAALALGAALIWAAIAAARRWRSDALSAGALGGLACVAIQSNVDFGVEILGLAIPVVMLAATVMYTHGREAPRKLLLAARSLRVGLIAALVGGAALMFADCTRSIDEDRVWVQESGSQLDLPALSDIIERHPLSYYPFAVAAQQLARKDDPKGIRFLNHAMLLHPTHPGLHHMAARMLRHAGFEDQAIIEYAATLRGSVDKQRMLAEILGQFSDEKAMLVLPSEPRELEATVKLLVELKRSHVATLWLTRLLQIQPSAHVCEVLFEISVQGSDLRAIEAAARNCMGAMPDRHTRLALSRLLYANKHFAEILQLLADVESWSGRIDDTVTAWLLLCDAHVGLGQLDEAKRCLRRLDVSGEVRGERQPELKARLEEIEKLRKAVDPGSKP